MRYRRLAGVLFVAALSLSTASAATFFTGTGTGDVTYSSWNIPGGIFGYFYDYYDVTPSCTGGYCVAASDSGGATLGNYLLTIAPNYFVSNAGDGQLVTVGGGTEYEEIVPFPQGATGSILMDNANFSIQAYLLAGNVSGIGVYAIPGSNVAAFQIDITNATSQVIGGLPSTLYLDIFGTTTAVVTTSTYNVTDTVFNNFTLDWTTTLTDSSALNLTGSSTTPEPSSLFLVAGGVVWMAARRLRGRNAKRMRI